MKETRNETYRRLARLAGEVGVDEKEVYGLLEVGEKPGEDGGLNGGNGVTDDVKVLVKVSWWWLVSCSASRCFSVSARS